MIISPFHLLKVVDPVRFPNTFVGMHIGLGQAPEALQAIDVHITNYVFLLSMMHYSVNVA